MGLCQLIDRYVLGLPQLPTFIVAKNTDNLACCAVHIKSKQCEKKAKSQKETDTRCKTCEALGKCKQCGHIMTCAACSYQPAENCFPQCWLQHIQVLGRGTVLVKPEKVYHASSFKEALKKANAIINKPKRTKCALCNLCNLCNKWLDK